MRSHGRPWLAFAVALFAACSAWAVGPAKLVADQSQIGFVSKQMGVPVEGTFKRFEASIAFDPRKPDGGTVALQIDTASASFGIAQTDAELPRSTWFDAAHHPRASFRSSAIKALGGGRFEVAGTLSLKGQTRDLVVPVAITQSYGKSVATGSFTLKRLEFKIGDGEWTDTSMVADEVQVRFKLTFTDLGPL